MTKSEQYIFERRIRGMEERQAKMVEREQALCTMLLKAVGTLVQQVQSLRREVRTLEKKVLAKGMT